VELLTVLDSNFRHQALPPILDLGESDWEGQIPYLTSLILNVLKHTSLVSKELKQTSLVYRELKRYNLV
jgi:hypothetical protein